MNSNIYIANVTLNKGQALKEMFVIENDKHGLLLVDNELFSISFQSLNDAIMQGVKIEYIKVVYQYEKYL